MNKNTYEEQKAKEIEALRFKKLVFEANKLIKKAKINYLRGNLG